MNPTVIGHRGVAAEAPENSLASLEFALELGAGALELDVRRSRDGTWARFNRQTCPPHRIRTFRAGQCRSASRRSSRYSNDSRT